MRKQLKTRMSIPIRLELIPFLACPCLQKGMKDQCHPFPRFYLSEVPIESDVPFSSQMDIKNKFLE